MQKRNVVVIGASAGGFEAIKLLVSRLPADLDASIFIVWHIAPDLTGVLPHVINRLGKMPAHNARDGEPIKTNQIYIAPPDYQMILEKDIVRTTHGPKENRFRPAIDPLFRSAAYNFGNRVIGVILTGALDDGSAGLWAVKDCGGIAIVQDPKDAEVSSMPQNALRAVKNADYKVPVNEIADIIVRLVQEEVDDVQVEKAGENGRMLTEIKIAMEDPTLDRDVFKLGKLTPYTCPDCHGVLTSLKEGRRIRFRCHTGHAFSSDTLLSAISQSIEESLWNSIRTMQESIIFLNHMGDHFAENNEPKIAALYFKKAGEAQRRAELVRDTVFDHEQLSIDKIQQESEHSA